MREHRYSVEMPHAPERLWALFQDDGRWTEYAPMVLRVEVLWPGDAGGKGLLRADLVDGSGAAPAEPSVS